MRGRFCTQPFLVERSACHPNAFLLPLRWVSRSPPHPPQCAHWGTFPPRGRLWGDEPDLETVFHKNAFQHIFSRKCVPNRFLHIRGNSPSTVAEITTAKTSEWERAAIRTGGPGGLPPALFLPISREKWGPPPGRRGPRGAAPQGQLWSGPPRGYVLGLLQHHPNAKEATAWNSPNI